MDWNSDALPDLLVGETNGQVRYYRNIGSPGNPVLTFAGLLLVGGVTLDVGSYSCPFANDWNEDGNIDLLVGGDDGKIRLYINTGQFEEPTFNTTAFVQSATGAQLDFGDRSCPVVVDLNANGIKDLVAGALSGRVYYCQNNGTNANPALAAQLALACGSQEIYPHSTTRVAALDWNNDNHMDLIVGSYDPRMRLYLWAASTPLKPVTDLTLTSSYQVPASGGTVTFTIQITNNTGSAQLFDFWSDLYKPGYIFEGPLILRRNVNINAGATITRNVSYTVLPSHPAGYYYYYGYVGEVRDRKVYSQDYFYFYKSSTDGAPLRPEFCLPECSTTNSWEIEESVAGTTVLPSEIALSAAPNPFNPSTAICYQLSAFSNVSLKVYDMAGRLVTTLVEGWREAGTHQITWEASGLPSGVYFARLQVENNQIVKKLLLTK